MIDLSHIHETPGLSVFLPQGVDANSWQAWQKPRGFFMATIYAIGPGGGGGSGACNPINFNRGGGGGGASGSCSRLTLPLFLLPDLLYVRVAAGGLGGSPVTSGLAGNNGTTSTTTMVAVYPSTTVQYLLVTAKAGLNGNGGTTSGSNASPGFPGGITAQTECPLSYLGSFLSISGNTGGQGSSSANGLSITQSTGSQIYGGAGGAGVSGSTAARSGGSILAVASSPFVASPGGVADASGGSNGFNWPTVFPMKIYGGTGGASAGYSSGFNAGSGSAPGAGGGGGGAGSYGTSGAGGDGGPGCVIIQCW